jgi:hypothetical protein
LNSVKAEGYGADNVPFGAAEFVADLELKGQMIYYS